MKLCSINKIIILIVLITLLLSGCWSYREIDTLAIVIGAAIDYNEDLDQIEITSQILNPGGVATPQGGGDAEPFFNVTMTGDTMFDAVRKSVMVSDRRLYWAHNEIIIISIDAAKKGIKPYLDFFVQDTEPRASQWIALTEGRASDVLDISKGLENMPTLNIASLIESRTSHSFSGVVTLGELLNRMVDSTTSPVTGIISIVENNEDKALTLAGTGVLKKNTYTGRLNAKESRGMLLAIGELKGGIIVAKMPDTRVSLEIISVDSKLDCKVIDGKITGLIDIELVSALGGQTGTVDFTITENINKLTTAQDKRIMSEISSAVTKAKVLGTDVFGFGEKLYKNGVKNWSEIEKNWEEEFKNMEVLVSIKSSVKYGGLTNKPLKKGLAD